jgi:hypothetical protein
MAGGRVEVHIKNSGCFSTLLHLSKLAEKIIFFRTN